MLTPADEINHINKHNFKVPMVCGCRDLGEALRRIAEGCSMIRTKGEAGTGNVVEAGVLSRSSTRLTFNLLLRTTSSRFLLCAAV